MKKRWQILLRAVKLIWRTQRMNIHITMPLRCLLYTLTWEMISFSHNMQQNRCSKLLRWIWPISSLTYSETLSEKNGKYLTYKHRLINQHQQRPRSKKKKIKTPKQRKKKKMNQVILKWVCSTKFTCYAYSMCDC